VHADLPSYAEWVLWICALNKDTKRRRVGGRSPTLGVNHIYHVLWLLCALWLLCELCLVWQYMLDASDIVS
jgi:hypothetical protein